MFNQTEKKSDIPTYFILGYPRSGTTWFANLFNAHPDVVYRHEMFGRCHMAFPEKLDSQLDYAYKLSDQDHKTAVNIILLPNVESDRAPFFKKNHLMFSSVTLHYLFWVAAKKITPLRALYKLLFVPRKKNLILLIKETRFTIKLDSIIKGIRSNKNIVLFRHPCGAIASCLSGIKTGKMMSSTIEEREIWFNENKDRDYIKKLPSNTEIKSTMPEYEYLALMWRLQNQDYIKFSRQDNNYIFISYEQFIENPGKSIQYLFTAMNLPLDPNVSEFINISSGKSKGSSILKDSSNEYYSVYRNAKYNPNKWQESLTKKEISIIKKHTLDILNQMQEIAIH